MSSIADSFLSYLDSFATVTYSTQLSKHYGQSAPVVPLFLIHQDNANQAIPIPGGAVVDTGAEDTVLNQRYAKLIGIDDIKKNGIAVNIGGAGGKLSALYYIHNNVKLRIGNLQPVSVPVTFGPNLEEDNVIGRSALRQYIITLTQQQIRITDYAAKAKAAYVQAYNAALMAGNYQAHYRNRI
jgi:hypothetical protein